jgi:hypothetical protein
MQFWMRRAHFSSQRDSSRSINLKEGFDFYIRGKGKSANSAMHKEMNDALYQRPGPRSFEAILSEEVTTSSPSLKKIGDRSELAGYTGT